MQDQQRSPVFPLGLAFKKTAAHVCRSRIGDLPMLSVYGRLSSSICRVGSAGSVDDLHVDRIIHFVFLQRQADPPQEVLKARVGSERVKCGLTFDKRDHVRMPLISCLKPL